MSGAERLRLSRAEYLHHHEEASSVNPAVLQVPRRSQAGVDKGRAPRSPLEKREPAPTSSHPSLPILLQPCRAAAGTRPPGRWAYHDLMALFCHCLLRGPDSEARGLMRPFVRETNPI